MTVEDAAEDEPGEDEGPAASEDADEAEATLANIKHLQETARLYREEGRQIFERIERMAKMNQEVREASEALRKLEQERGRAVREVDVAEKLGISIDDYRDIQSDAVQCQMLSLETPRDEDEPEAWQVQDLAALTPAEHLQNREFQKALADAIRTLPEKEQLVLSLYYRDELNLREIGEVMNVSESTGHIHKAF